MTPKGSRGARIAGALCLLAIFAGVAALVLRLRGTTPAAVLGLEVGAFLGLVSLVIEMAMVERASRTFYAQGVQTTFLSFMMRLVLVAPATLLFMKPALGVDHEAFALAYCSTFFLYLCWLTWRTYHAPSSYRPRAQSGAAGRITVRDNRDARIADAWTVR